MRYLCDYGNCIVREDGLRMITVTNNITRDKRRFCSWQHVAAYCTNRAERGENPKLWEDAQEGTGHHPAQLRESPKTA